MFYQHLLIILFKPKEHKTIHMHIVYRFAYSSQMSSSYLFLMIWLQTHLLYSILFFFFLPSKPRMFLSGTGWMITRESQTSQCFIFYVLCSELTNTSHGLYECLYNKAKGVWAKSRPPLILRSVQKLWTFYRNILFYTFKYKFKKFLKFQSYLCSISNQWDLSVNKLIFLVC